MSPRQSRPTPSPGLRARLILSLALCLPAAGVAQAPAPDAAPAPAVDAHIHVLSEAGAARLARRPDPGSRLDAEPRGGRAVLAMLDEAGVRRGVIISQAYQLAVGAEPDAEEYAAVRAENDWVGEEAARSGGRLVGFCSVHPLREYALREVERCAASGRLRGLKLYLSVEGIDLRRADHAARIRTVFARADALGMPILVHLRTLSPGYGAPDARVFLERILPAAPDVDVQVAHLAGWGGYDDATDHAMSVFAAAARAGTLPPRLYFDLAFVLPFPAQCVADVGEDARVLLERVRRRVLEIGAERVVFGSDSPLYATGDYAAALRCLTRRDPTLQRTLLGSAPRYLR